MGGDLIAVMLHLTATKVLSKPGDGNSVGGYQSYAAFMDLLRQVDPELSTRLHEPNERKSFTLSCLLQNGRMATGQFYNGRNYELRLTSLNGPVFDTFIKRFFTVQKSTLPIRIGSAEFALTRIEGSGDYRRDWVGRSSFVQLAQECSGAKDQLETSLNRNWAFTFVTPTVFSLGKQEWGSVRFELFPLPKLLFGSLAKNWNTFAPNLAQLPPIDQKMLEEYVEKYVVVTYHDTLSNLLTIKGHPQVGFTGRVNYRLMDKNATPEMVATLNCLTYFANFAGVGYKTTMGMGQVKPQIGGGFLT